MRIIYTNLYKNPPKVPVSLPYYSRIQKTFLKTLL